MELHYIGKIEKFENNHNTKKLVVPDFASAEKDEGPVKKVFRQFIVRRKRSMEIMLTNGLTYWTEPVPNSETYEPFEIIDMAISNDKRLLVIQQCIPDNPVGHQSKVFTFDSDTNNYALLNSGSMYAQLDKNNLTLDQDGNIQ